MQQKTKMYVYLIPLTLYLIFPGCKKDLTPADNTPPEIKLTMEDVGVTEVWLRLKIQDKSSKSQIKISRDDSTIQQFNNLTTDTLIYDSGLLPNREYHYKAVFSSGLRSLVSSLRITTMDTTSHDFTWQSWTFGAKGSSILYDVAIIDENNIWAVGEIYTEDTYTYDSLGNWIDPYNVVHWDGIEWELLRLNWENNGSVFWSPIRTILAFANDDIWLGGFYWNGFEFIQKPMNISFPYRINKVWGFSSTDYYVVANEGKIAYYNGQTWQRIESGVSENINDIWGVVENESKYILITVSNKYSTGDTKLLRINEDNTITDENWVTKLRDPYSVWFMNSKRIFVCGAGIFTRNLYNHWHEFSEVPLIYTNRIRGNNINDIFVAGDSGIVTHYNGISWKIYDEAAIALFRSMDFKDDIVVAVGGANPIATILMGQRQ